MAAGGREHHFFSVRIGTTVAGRYSKDAGPLSTPIALGFTRVSQLIDYPSRLHRCLGLLPPRQLSHGDRAQARFRPSIPPAHFTTSRPLTTLPRTFPITLPTSTNRTLLTEHSCRC